MVNGFDAARRRHSMRDPRAYELRLDALLAEAAGNVDSAAEALADAQEADGPKADAHWREVEQRLVAEGMAELRDFYIESGMASQGAGTRELWNDWKMQAIKRELAQLRARVKELEQENAGLEKGKEHCQDSD